MTSQTITYRFPANLEEKVDYICIGKVLNRYDECISCMKSSEEYCIDYGLVRVNKFVIEKK